MLYVGSGGCVERGLEDVLEVMEFHPSLLFIPTGLISHPLHTGHHSLETAVLSQKLFTLVTRHTTHYDPVSPKN